ncbi:hypothetical protein M4R23_07295 [Acidovorax sp. GBBC 3332]|nr:MULTISPECIES: RHS repeat-associated core domain-containing protein [unclassified Acidovorax]MDA8449214.1 hypothetical protein [Acidovorax sp. GBBC 3297]MDA8458698.1 hypothetical protein [Acidovorax sp. GBBC 3333]MDA8463970.1 hypothetical protein [Acidovorax sp. GBBC 3332]MDA8469002.1 hypothetical protein [Acidovorax sp. GBBC 3299]WCM80600.1 hypothetical protein M5C94_10100 [Acidovorax sp. GBBC 712]
MQVLFGGGCRIFSALVGALAIFFTTSFVARAGNQYCYVESVAGTPDQCFSSFQAAFDAATADANGRQLGLIRQGPYYADVMDNKAQDLLLYEYEAKDLPPARFLDKGYSFAPEGMPKYSPCDYKIPYAEGYHCKSETDLSNVTAMNLPEVVSGREVVTPRASTGSWVAVSSGTKPTMGGDQPSDLTAPHYGAVVYSGRKMNLHHLVRQSGETYETSGDYTRVDPFQCPQGMVARDYEDGDWGSAGGSNPPSELCMDPHVYKIVQRLDLSCGEEGCNSAGIQLGTGAHALNEDLLSIEGFPVSLAYDSKSRSWDLSFEKRMASGGNDSYIEVAPGTYSRLFVDDGEGFGLEGRPADRVTNDDNGSIYTSGNFQYKFNDDGRVAEFGPMGQAPFVVQRDDGGRVVRLTSPAGRTLNFEYVNGRISKVTGGDREVLLEYDASGNLSKIWKDASAVRQFLYGEQGLIGVARQNVLTGVVDEQGQRQKSFGYDANDRLTYKSEGGGDTPVNTVRVSYPDAAHTQVVTAAGATRSYTLREDAYHRPISELDPSGQISKQYDENQRIIKSIAATGSVTQYTYSSDPSESIVEGLGSAQQRRVEITRSTYGQIARRLVYDAAGKPVAGYMRTFNARGQMLASTQFQSSQTAAVRTSTTTYCENDDISAGTCPLLGLVIKVDGPRSDKADVTTYTYRMADAPNCATISAACPYRKGDLWKVTNALGQVTEYLAYDGAGRALSVKSANGVVTDFSYHSRGWLTASKVRGADDSSESDDRITAIDYWPTGLVKQVTQPDGAFTRFTYDAAHRLTDIADSAGNTIHYTLDNAGNRSKEDTKDASGTLKRTLSRVYNQLGQLATQATAQGDPTDFGYDGNGNTKTVTDALGHVTQNDYDPLNRLARTLQDVGGIAAETKFGYDALDNLTKVTDPKGLDTTYAYNGLGDLTKLTSPDTGSTTYTYDSAGNRATQTDARNIKTSYGYDALNRLTQVTYPTTSLNVSYTYDVSQSTCASGETYAVGRLTRMQDGSGSTDYCYDRFGDLVRKVQTTNGKVFVVRYAYTKAGQLSRLTYPDGAVVDYVRNAQGQTIEVGVTPPGGTRQVLLNQATYYPFGPVAGWTYGNGRPMQRVLDQDYRPLAVNDTRSDGLAVGFAFDPVGNLGALTAPGNTAPVIKLDYDPLGRLTAFKDGPTDTVIDGYTYDATGNRLSAKVNTSTQTYSYPTTSHRLGSVAGTARSYDAAGNTTAIGGTAVQYVYGANGRLSQVNRNGAKVANYAYNGRGEQVRRVGSTSTYTLYDESGHWLGDYDNNGAVVQQAIWLDDLPVGVLAKTTLRYVQPDHLGTPRAVIDPVRDVAIWRWDLKGEAFGATAPDQDPDKDGTVFVFDMRFPGQRYDALSGLNQNYFRDYEPGTGRYVQSDPLGLTAGASTYAYVSARPLQGVDSLGLADDFYLPTEVPETPELQAVRSRLQGLANRAEATVDATCGLRCALPWIRGTLIHSEFKRLVDTTCPASDYATEVSYKGGIVVRYGADDSSRADVVYGPIDRPKVVFDLKTGLAYLTWGQFNAYGKNLPPNTPVSVIRPEGAE